MANNRCVFPPHTRIVPPPAPPLGNNILDAPGRVNVNKYKGRNGETDSALLRHLFRLLLKEDSLACMLTAYFDESGTHGDGSPVMSVAGYLFDAAGGEKFDKEWGEALGTINASWFHMKDFVVPRGEFKSLTNEEAAGFIEKLVNIIKARALCGFAIAVNQREAKEYSKKYPEVGKLLGTPYTICVMACVAGVGEWVRQNYSGNTEVAYFFANGHSNQGEALDFLKMAKRISSLKEKYQFASITFIESKNFRPLQSADLLAWTYCKSLYNQIESKPHLKNSLDNLLEQSPHRFLVFDSNNIALQAMHLRSHGFPFKIKGRYLRENQ